MATLDDDVRTLKEWLRGAWGYLADPALTSFDRREIRNYMKEAEFALSAGLKRIRDREQARRKTGSALITNRRLDFRIFQLDV
jgi:hypothetical protein